jgi:hypothetical protein
MDGLVEQAFAVTRADGRLSVTHMPVQAPLRCFHPDTAAAHGFIEKDGLWVRELTDEMIVTELTRVCEALGTEMVSWRALTADDTAAYFDAGDFRGAHVDDGKGLRIDMSKARDMARNHIRAKRPELLARLDNAMKSLELKAGLGTISDRDKRSLMGLEEQRQVLRDAPASPSIDAAATIDELRAFVSDIG